MMIKNVNPLQQMIGYLGEIIVVIRRLKQNEDQQVNGILNNLLNQVNTEEVMKNIDSFIETAQEFKPLWTKLYPHIQKWIKK